MKDDIQNLQNTAFKTAPGFGKKYPIFLIFGYFTAEISALLHLKRNLPKKRSSPITFLHGCPNETDGSWEARKSQSRNRDKR